MAASVTIAIWYYNGQFYLPTTVRSLAGLIGFTTPVAVVPAAERARLVEAIELCAVAGNPTLSNADFRATTDTVLLDAMGLKIRQDFYTKTTRWAVVEEDGGWLLIPFKPGWMRGVEEDREHAVPLPAASFATAAADAMLAGIERG